MKTVIFAEKPSQARDYANALGISHKKDGYIEGVNPMFDGGVIITWGFGHLVELKLPKDYSNPINNWDLKNLPYRPNPFEYKVSEGKSKQFNIVKSLFKDADILINATDIDREGSNIFYSTLKLTGVKNKTIKRLWINSLVEKEIKKGFQQLQNNHQDYQNYQEAYARQTSDYLIGMNLSPVYSKIFQLQGVQDVFSIGRVQTPTLYMIYERYLAIENFKPETFYEIFGEFKSKNGCYKGKAKIKTTDKQEIINLGEKHNLKDAKEGIITKLETQEKRTSSPKLHSLSTLQSKINKQYKYSPEKTKNIVQSLYEKKILSYPRTDCNYITSEEYLYLKENLQSLMNVYNKHFSIVYDKPRARYVNNEKVKEHYAIIPTSQIPTPQNIEKLSQDEKYVLDEVVSTTLSMFANDYVYDETKIETNVNQLIFYTTGHTEIQKGWKILFKHKGNEKSPEQQLPKLIKNECVKASIYSKKGITQSPKLYTEGQLITLMKSCGKYLDDEEAEILKEIQGIGTEATRDGIIQSLKNKNYIKIEKNKVHITAKGILLCKAVKGSLLASATMTAAWEKRLKLIGQGQANTDNFIDITMKFIDKEIKAYQEKCEDKSIINQSNIVAKDNKFGECPNCTDGQLIDKNKIISCTNCEQVFFKNFYQKKLTDKQIQELIFNGKTAKKLKLKNKAGKTYEAYLILTEDKKTGTKRYNISFD
ncbi:TPA: DNA topoisomerase III [Staphylococcus aureus]|uniref:DNA topoisomerase n=2 Tax=Staphylococcus aureus TaxID=1280 RepID=D2J7M5_STAAU|nr:DNA topoisomerase [Staphylococcus aureus]ACZ58774.1 DNA topoisomerase III [Staphylococcus aureus]ACZ66214.1 DNA topoisomerase III [Staphylococcus aureus]QSH89322.1 DNA topoisomerase III [Staphylococcus aureus]HDE4503626.1 DNA topoisomerase III [Staphylococcus aureus]